MVESAGEGGYGVEATAKIMGIVEEVGGERGTRVGIGVLFAGGGVEV